MTTESLLDSPQVSLGAEALCDVFHQTFWDRFNTRLEGGGSEPIYLPESEQRPYHLIVYSHDYAASALHEIAHWCVAGEQRRLLEDYGYWYAPDGRTQEQQQDFEKVEVRPQAFEWIFSKAAGRAFRVSADNLEAGVGASDNFRQAIFQQVVSFCRHGLPSRPKAFVEALAKRSQVANPLSARLYRLDDLT
ncbi:MAG: elongation factor P hydroxylase [Cellvibrionaceae bacterium]